MAAVTVGVGGSNGLFVEFGQQNVSDGSMDGFRGVLQKIGETDVEAAFPEANGGVERGEALEANIEGRNGRAGAEVAVLLFKYGD